MYTVNQNLKKSLQFFRPLRLPGDGEGGQMPGEQPLRRLLPLPLAEGVGLQQRLPPPGQAGAAAAPAAARNPEEISLCAPTKVQSDDATRPAIAAGILGLAVQPTYDPNDYQTILDKNLLAQIEALPEGEERDEAKRQAQNTQCRNKAVSDR